MMKDILIAPCGMICAIYSGYLALQNDIKRKGGRMPYCAGCRPRGKQCAFLRKRCKLLLENKIKYCFECPDFPCRNLKHLDDRYRTHHHVSMVENLEYIEKHGIKKFLVSQRRKWKCPNCNGIICCHNGLCFTCDLKKLKDKKQKYRWED